MDYIDIGKIGRKASESARGWRIRTGRDLIDTPEAFLDKVTCDVFQEYHKQLLDEKKKRGGSDIMVLTSSTKSVLNAIVDYHEKNPSIEIMQAKDIEKYIKRKKAKREMIRILHFLDCEGYFESTVYMADRKTVSFVPSAKALFFKEYSAEKRRIFWIEKIVFSFIAPIVIAVITSILTTL